MKLSEADFLIVPGFGNSGPGHWQLRWRDKIANARIIQQSSWDKPSQSDWADKLHHEILMATRPVVLVGHGLGNHAIVHAAKLLTDTKVKGALLVAPVDLANKKVPNAARKNFETNRDPLPFPSLLIGSDNDRFCSQDAAHELADCWGAEFHVAREAGHINTESGHGLWPDGLMMLGRLLKRI